MKRKLQLLRSYVLVFFSLLGYGLTTAQIIGASSATNGSSQTYTVSSTNSNGIFTVTGGTLTSSNKVQGACTGAMVMKQMVQPQQMPGGGGGGGGGGTTTYCYTANVTWGSGSSGQVNFLVSGSVTATRTVTLCPSTIPTPTASFTISKCGSISIIQEGNRPANVTWYWQTSATGTSISNSSHVFTSATSGNFYLRGQSSCGSWGPAQSVGSITIDPIPGAATAVSSTSSCGSSGNITISGTPGTNGDNLRFYTTSTGTTPSSTGTSWAAQANGPNAFYVSTYNSTTGCETGVSARVAVTPVINTIPTVSAPNQTICSGGASIVFTNNVAGTVNTWSATMTNASGAADGSGTSGTTSPYTYSLSQTLAATGSSAGTVTYTIVPSANGCTGSSLAMTVTVKPVPNLTINGSTANSQSTGVCANTYTSISLGSSVSGTTYSWTLPVVSNATGGSTATNTTATSISDMLHLLSPGSGLVIYNVTPMSNGCTGTGKSIIVNVNPIPSAPTGVTASAFCGPAGSTTITGAAGSDGNTLNFYTSQAAGAPSATGPSWTTPANVAPTFYVGSLNTQTGCATNSGSWVAVTPQPNVPPAPSSASNGSICTGSDNPAVLSAVPGSGADNIRWYSSDIDTPGVLSTGTSYSVLVGSTTFYWAASYNSTCGTESPTRAKVFAFVSPVPAVPSITGGGIHCRPDIFSLSASVGTGGDVVKWYSGPSSFVASGTTYTTPTLSATATYYATSYNSSTQCESAMSSVVLTISSYPAAPSVTTPSPVCISGAFSLTATPGAGGNNINWYSVPSGGSALFSGTSVTTPSIASTTVYYAETIGTLGCLSQARTPVTATVNPEPIATGLSATSVCPYGASVVTGSPGPNGTTLKIYDGMLVNSNWLNHSGGTSYTTPSLTSSTTYYVASFNSTTGCESSFDDRMPVTAVVNPTPAAPPLSDITVSTNTCDPKTLSCSGAPNGVSWYWQGNSANGTDTSPLAAASTYIAATNGSNQYYIGARSSSGCWNASNTAVTVNVQIRPTADASVNPTIFSGQATSVQFTNTNNVPGTIYSWTVSSSSNVSGAAAGVGSSITQNISINNGTSGAVTYNVIPSANGCAGPAFTPVVTVYPVPVITPPQAYIVGGSATLDIGPGYSSYRWFKDTGSLSDQRTMTTSQTGTYSCTVTMLGGATYTQSFTVNSQFSGVQMNYVVTNSALVSGISDPAALENLPVEQVNQSVGYFDGLGRLVQTVITQGSPLKNDLVTPTTYDAFGRESRKYLLVSLESNGRYKNILMGSDGTYTNVLNYNNNEPDKVIDDTRPFSETIFEPSPLNRPLQQFGPGQDWKTNNKYVGYQYLVNQTNEVYLFIYEAATGLVTLPSGPSGYYNAGQLYAHVTTDERGNDVIEYIDKLNRTVCKKVQYGSDANGKLYASTYYLYDDLGNLVVVLPPEAVKKLEK